MSFNDAPSYGQNRATASVSNNNFPSEGPKVFPILTTFPAAGTAVIDLTMQVQSNQISYIQGAWVRNDSANTFILRSNSTGQAISIAPGAQGFAQLLSQNPPVFELESDGEGSLEIIFVNFPVLHSLEASGGSGPTVNVYDEMKSILVGGANVTITPNDAIEKIIVAASGGGGGGGGGQWNSSYNTGPVTLDAADFDSPVALFLAGYTLTSCTVTLPSDAPVGSVLAISGSPYSPYKVECAGNFFTAIPGNLVPDEAIVAAGCTSIYVKTNYSGLDIWFQISKSTPVDLGNVWKIVNSDVSMTGTSAANTIFMNNGTGNTFYTILGTVPPPPGAILKVANQGNSAGQIDISFAAGCVFLDGTTGSKSFDVGETAEIVYTSAGSWVQVS